MSLTGRRPDLGFSERVERLGALTSHLKSLATRAALRRPAWRMLLARSLVYLLPGVALLLLAGERYGSGALLLLATPAVAGLLLFFDVGQRGRMAWHVRRYAGDEPSDAEGADAAISGKRGKLVLLGVAEWLERKLQGKAKSDDAGLVMKLIAGVVGEVLDVAGAFLVPAVVLDDVTIEEGVEKVKALKRHAPEALLASVGFDAVASLLSSFFWAPVILVPLIAVAGVIAGFLTISQAAATAGVIALLLAVPLAAVQTLREAAKAVYFTSLYLLVAHRDEIVAGRLESLEGLVRLTDPEETPEPVVAAA